MIDSFLFECKCVLFLVDITNLNSFHLIKLLIHHININKYPYLREILILNKYDLKGSNHINNYEIETILKKINQ